MVNFESLFGGVYKNKKVLLTGHRGFKGSWLALWLQQMGAIVYGYSLDNEDEVNHFSLLNLDIEEKIGDITVTYKNNAGMKKETPAVRSALRKIVKPLSMVSRA